MRVVLQRVTHASVTVEGSRVASIERGFLALVGVGVGDPSQHPAALATKVAGLRVFADDDGKMNLALTDVGGSVLVVSQFTLYGDARKGRRPSFIAAEEPGRAAELVEAFASSLEGAGIEVARGVFGADMQVDLCNDGPVTLLLDADGPSERPSGGPERQEGTDRPIA